MIKTEMMKQYEQETGETLDVAILAEDASGSWYGYIDMVDAKAEAYDRLMSGGLTMKEIANILKQPVAIENDEGQNMLYYFGSIPHLGQFSDGAQFWSCKRKWRMPRQLVNFYGDWQDSLTLPDGWEDTDEN